MKYLYYDCFSGISGDMNLGAMLDLGVPEEYLKDELKKLPVSGYRIEVRQDIRRGVTGTKVDVMLEGEDAEYRHADSDAHTHDHDSHGHDHDHQHTHDHEEHGHSHDEDHGAAHHHHDTGSYASIREAIGSSDLNQEVKDVSLRIFRNIAEAEAKIHGNEIDAVHFHEVGSVDAIIDIVGAAVCFDYVKQHLGVQGVIASTVEVGGGMVRCAHGLFPVPAPAVSEILKGVPVHTGRVPFEATTPTGAAILKTVTDEFVTTTDFVIEKVAYGLGTKDAETPNVVRLCLVEREIVGDRVTDTDTTEAVLVEANIDDMNPEVYEHVMELLFGVGAKDVYMTPIIMKKSRPAVILSTLCSRSELAAVREILFLHTTTLGVRERVVTKTFLRREETIVNTKYGKVRVKRAFYDGREIKAKPENEDCRRLASEAGVNYTTVVRAALDAL